MGDVFGYEQAKAESAAQKKKIADLQRALGEQQQYGPGYLALAQTEQERQAGVTPPGFQGLSDLKTGELLDRYKYDPFAGEAAQKIRGEALSTGPSEYAKQQLEQQKFEQSQQMGSAGRQAQAAQSGALSQLARTGGLGAGARTSLARSGMRDLLQAQQGVGAQGVQQRYGINAADLQRRQQLLGQVAGSEQEAAQKNIGTGLSDLQARAQFQANRYNQQMQAWAANQSANAQRDVARQQNSGKK